MFDPFFNLHILHILLFQPRQNLLQAAGNVGQASGELLSHIGETDTDPQFQVSQSLLELKSSLLMTGGSQRSGNVSLMKQYLQL